MATLNLSAVIGTGGLIANGIINHPDGIHLIFSLGATVVIKNTKTNEQAFLQGHTGTITALALSHDGKYIASGQQTPMGFTAEIMIWSVADAIRNGNTACQDGELVHKLALHKGFIQALAFSSNDNYLASVGGQDDNNLVVWNVGTGTAICGSRSASDSTLCVQWLNTTEDTLVTCGRYSLRRWAFDAAGRKINPVDAHSSLRRIFTCLDISADDTRLYCGSQSGDISEFNLLAVEKPNFIRSSVEKVPNGVSAIKVLGADALLVGGGDGSLMIVSPTAFKITKAKTVQLIGGVTGIAPTLEGDAACVSTADGNRYFVTKKLEPVLQATSHHSPISDVCFPQGCSDIIVTSAADEIRVWNVATRMELLRIKVPNLKCHCVCLLPDGSSIVSGWDDGAIRAFFPESGKLQYVIKDAHADCVTAIQPTHDGGRLVSGGEDGRVRIWKLLPRTQPMEANFKEHKGAVNRIVINSDDTECISASSDGSCCVWNLEKYTRTSAFFASTKFMDVDYLNDDSQIVTCGSDRKVTYWDGADYSPIRVMEASTEEINSLEIGKDGSFFVCGGNDNLIKVWAYDEGIEKAVGKAHSSSVTQVRISPDAKYIISVGGEGAIYIWDVPEEYAARV